MNIEEYICKIKYTSKELYNRCCSVYKKADKEDIIKVIIPILIVSVGVYACSLSRNEAHKNVKEIFNIADSIRSHYVGKADYWGLSTSSLIKNNVLPKKYILNDKIIINNSREILIGSGIDADIVMPQSQSFDIVMKGLNKSQCIAYAETKLSDDKLVSISKISIANSLGFYSFEWGGKNMLPIKNYASKDFCNTNDNTIIWTIK